MLRTRARDELLNIPAVARPYKDISSTFKMKETNFPGLISSKNWQIFELSNRPGLIIISNPFTVCAQRYWMYRSVADYSKHPNRTNLPQNFIDKYSSYSPNSLPGESGTSPFDWWEVTQAIEDPQERVKAQKALRWTTLGYHYDWDNKVYEEAARDEFPSDLGRLCCHFARALGFLDFRAEAAIVNYYPIGSTLAGHTDHSEKNLDAPLFSFSFGQSAIFLIGGPTKDERPDALLLRSGDVVVMTRASRLCYHAVPRVFHLHESTAERWEPATEPEEDCGSAAESNYGISSAVWNNCRPQQRETGGVVDGWWNAIADYIGNSRININIRQVLNEGENHL
ncbi:nucleic acid dioxygenase ALKBH1 isoform X2 [Uranotaenia lowii]|uniref:nucleic acid dioxygenase ALKBH1 isoform X2 n=1 Tax=Uranotaenia lowii TaxID=190385 RepID=UPI00247868A8|nr:nucleic acid dioxygenase ALKBH1 isoform X2 [Uranotaenia lowii]